MNNSENAGSVQQCLKNLNRKLDVAHPPSYRASRAKSLEPLKDNFLKKKIPQDPCFTFYTQRGEGTVQASRQGICLRLS